MGVLGEEGGEGGVGAAEAEVGGWGGGWVGDFLLESEADKVF